ncbi:MAG: isoaspartyl peptidase/L-asparaginase [Bradyrhizobiaceae bacterium]|nr:isoaspartyl peptidase/L-asparaginase [Bradyrhizobiaceae bacterium]
MGEQRRRAYVESLTRILEESYPLLVRGRNAVTVVVRAVELLENDPLYNAGLGSKIQSDGRIRMSASLMDGRRLRFSGCVNVEGVKNPVRLAELLQTRDDRVLAEAGARRLAREAGLTFSSPFTPRARGDFERRRKGKSGTVGAVALDREHHMAAATSTGGRGFEYPHRVSDTPTVAANFANRFGAVSATGVGEEIVEYAVAARICALLEAGLSVEAASRRLLTQVRRNRAEFGWIALDRHGRTQAVTTTKTLIWGQATPAGITSF